MISCRRPYREQPTRERRAALYGIVLAGGTEREFDLPDGHPLCLRSVLQPRMYAPGTVPSTYAQVTVIAVQCRNQSNFKVSDSRRR